MSSWWVVNALFVDWLFFRIPRTTPRAMYDQKDSDCGKAILAARAQGNLQIRSGTANGHRAESRRHHVQASPCPLWVELCGSPSILLAVMGDNTHGVLLTRDAHPSLGAHSCG